MDPGDPLPQVAQGLERLKLRLVSMAADQVDPAETEAMAREISAIRLQLMRLRFEQAAMSERVAAARGAKAGLSGPPDSAVT